MTIHTKNQRHKKKTRHSLGAYNRHWTRYDREPYGYQWMRETAHLRPRKLNTETTPWVLLSADYSGIEERVLAHMRPAGGWYDPWV